MGEVGFAHNRPARSRQRSKRKEPRSSVRPTTRSALPAPPPTPSANSPGPAVGRCRNCPRTRPRWNRDTWNSPGTPPTTRAPSPISWPPRGIGASHDSHRRTAVSALAVVALCRRASFGVLQTPLGPLNLLDTFLGRGVQHRTGRAARHRPTRPDQRPRPRDGGPGPSQPRRDPPVSDRVRSAGCPRHQQRTRHRHDPRQPHRRAATPSHARCESDRAHGNRSCHRDHVQLRGLLRVPDVPDRRHAPLLDQRSGRAPCGHRRRAVPHRARTARPRPRRDDPLERRLDRRRLRPAPRALIPRQPAPAGMEHHDQPLPANAGRRPRSTSPTTPKAASDPGQDSPCAASTPLPPSAPASRSSPTATPRSHEAAGRSRCPVAPALGTDPTLIYTKETK